MRFLCSFITPRRATYTVTLTDTSSWTKALKKSVAWAHENFPSAEVPDASDFTEYTLVLKDTRLYCSPSGIKLLISKTS